MNPATLYAELLLVPMRVHGGRKVHLVGIDDAQVWRGASSALCGSVHEWARSSGGGADCAKCLRTVRVRLAWAKYSVAKAATVW